MAVRRVAMSAAARSTLGVHDAVRDLGLST